MSLGVFNQDVTGVAHPVKIEDSPNMWVSNLAMPHAQSFVLQSQDVLLSSPPPPVRRRFGRCGAFRFCQKGLTCRSLGYDTILLISILYTPACCSIWVY